MAVLQNIKVFVLHRPKLPSPLKHFSIFTWNETWNLSGRFYLEFENYDNSAIEKEMFRSDRSPRLNVILSQLFATTILC